MSRFQYCGWSLLLLLLVSAAPSASASFTNYDFTSSANGDLKSSAKGRPGGGGASFTLLGTKWDVGVASAVFVDESTRGQPGGASWSIMGAGIGLDGSLTEDLGSEHGGSTVDITELGVPSYTGLGDYESNIERALNIWAEASGFLNLGYVDELNGTVAAGASNEGNLGAKVVGDIRIGAWDINEPGVLAHAFQPYSESMAGGLPGDNIGGDMHIDTGFTWVDDANDGGGILDPDIDLFTVILHELGHSLGLGHTNAKGSIMNPTYSGGQWSLGSADIAGIQYLYGAGSGGDSGGGGNPGRGGGGGRKKFTAPAGANYQNVPEPTSSVLLVWAVGLAAFRRVSPPEAS